jgi:DNA-binding winged helix-turn-helix (wHTH) protein
MSSVPGDLQDCEKEPFQTRRVRFADFQFDPQEQVLSKNGVRIQLTRQVLEVLTALLEKPGQMVTREALQTRLWPVNTDLNYDAYIPPIVNKLRHALGDTEHPPSLIGRVSRRGYILIARVECEDRLATISPPANGLNSEEITRKSTFWSVLMMGRDGFWFVAGVIVLVAVSMLLGAAIAWYLR